MGQFSRIGPSVLLPVLAASCFWLAFIPPRHAAAQLPKTTLTGVFPPGAQRGTAIELAIDGDNLDGVDRLICSESRIAAERVTRDPGEFESGPQTVANRFRISIPEDVEPGSYELRVAGDFGLSNTRVFVVSDTGEVIETGEHRSMENPAELKVGQTANGRLASASVDWYRVELDVDQTITIVCAAADLDSEARPVLTVYDPAGDQLARTTDLTDSRLVIQARSSGPYRISVHDHTFAGGNEYVYRMSIVEGVVPRVAYPPVLVESQRPASRLIGLTRGPLVRDRDTIEGARWIPAEEDAREVPAEVSENLVYGANRLGPAIGVFSAQPVARLRHQSWPNGLPMWSVPEGQSCVVEPLELLDTLRRPPRGSESSIEVTPPVTVVGRFFTHGDVDWWEFDAREGDEYWIEVFSHRLGSPSAPRLVVQLDEAKSDDTAVDAGAGDGAKQRTWKTVRVVEQYSVGNERSNNNRPVDLNSRDPRYLFKAEKDGRYRLGLLDLYSQSRDDPSAVYRMDIRRPRPDVRLAAWVVEAVPGNDRQYELQPPTLRQGEALVVNVMADRVDGFDDEIRVTIEGLPEQLSCEPITLGKSRSTGQLVVRAAADAEAWEGPVRVVGEYRLESKPAGENSGSESNERREATIVTMTSSTNDVGRGRPNARTSGELWISVLARERMPIVVEFAPSDVGDEAAAGDNKSSEHKLRAVAGGKLTIPVRANRAEGFVKGVELRVVGLMDGIEAEPVRLGENSNEATLELRFTKPDLTPGEYEFYLQGQTQFRYERNTAAVAHWTEEKKRADGIVEQLRKEVKQPAEGSSEDEQKQRREKLARAEAFSGEIAKRLEQITKENEPKDVNVLIRSPMITVHVDAPPKDAEKPKE